jgi:20S proteasome alpha/beta subunit
MNKNSGYISFTFLIAFSFGIHSCDRINSNQKGTYFFAGICNDTIIIFSDSRSSFKNTNGTTIAYFDNVSKIYLFHHTALAMAGTTTFDSVYLKGIFKEFKTTYPDTISLDNFLDTFLDFASKKMTRKQFLELISNQFLVCGQLNNKPALFWYYKKEDSIYTGNGSYKTSAKITDNNPIVKNMLLTSNVENCVDEIAYSIKKMIEKENESKVSDIGGEISCLALTANKFAWMTRKNENDYFTQREFFDAYRENKMKMWYRSPNDSIELRNLFIKDGFK